MLGYQRDPIARMTEEQLDAEVEKLGQQAAEKSGNEQLAYEAELLVMVRRIRREGTPEQIRAIRIWIREHRGQDHRPYINSVMGWDG